jgi:RHS repeat-associated protein
VDRGNFTDTFSYDANGNMTCRTETGVTYLQTYNAENRIASIAKLASGSCTSPGDYSAKWDFTYDGNGVRTGQSYTRYTNGTPGAAVITRYYFGGSYETTGSTWKKYYSFAGQIIAMRDSTGLKYFLTDHLGSILAVTADNGTPISQQRYLPFGQVRTDLGWIAQTDFGYTGQRKLDDGMGGIMDYRARFYSPYLKQFSQPDTIVPELNNPQSLNRYAYALNNPVRYNDPSGHKACEDEDENGKCVTAAEKYNKEAKKNRDAKDPDDLKTSDKVKEQIKVWEGGFYDTPYLDGPNGLTGNCTIGYGTMLNDGPCPGSVKKQYNPKFGGAPLTEAQGSLWFQDDIMAAEQVIKDTVHVKLTQGQFDALVSYIYNSGGEPGHWYVDKKIPEKLNSGHYYEAAMVIESGPTGGNNVGYAPGLVPRRHQEATMFLYGLYP